MWSSQKAGQRIRTGGQGCRRRRRCAISSACCIRPGTRGRTRCNRQHRAKVALHLSCASCGAHGPRCSTAACCLVLVCSGQGHRGSDAAPAASGGLLASRGCWLHAQQCPSQSQYATWREVGLLNVLFTCVRPRGTRLLWMWRDGCMPLIACLLHLPSAIVVTARVATGRKGLTW